MTDSRNSRGSLPLETPRDGIKRAIVLSGGGARGAYEAGVLHYLIEDLPHRLGYIPRFDLYAGTSVGAVHVAHLAAFADDPSEGVRKLVQIWRDMFFGSVYSFDVSDAASFSKTLFGFAMGSASLPEPGADRIHGLLNTSPLQKLVVQDIPWRRLRRNIRSERVGALAVSTTEIATGRTVVFVDNRRHEIPQWTNDELLVARAGRVGPDHTLASAAIPFLFPAVRIKDTYYCDGSLRQQSPLSPALRLGANRVLSIGLRYDHPSKLGDRLSDERLEQFSSASYLFGKVLNSLLIDRLEFDLEEMRLINSVLRAGLEAYGPDHLDVINEKVGPARGLGWRIVEDCLVRPSQNIGMIAARHVDRLRKQRSRTWVGGLVFRLLTRGSPEDEADLMSYLLFDGGYADELIELGRADARAQEDELIEFFNS